MSRALGSIVGPKDRQKQLLVEKGAQSWVRMRQHDGVPSPAEAWGPEDSACLPGTWPEKYGGIWSSHECWAWASDKACDECALKGKLCGEPWVSGMAAWLGPPVFSFSTHSLKPS